MKALTLTQPWATLVAIGVKKLETRSWRTAYRGPLAIHAAKGFPKNCALLCNEDRFRQALRAHGITGADALPRGVVVATCNLIGCMETETIREAIEQDDEWYFGDYSDGRYAFQLARIVRLDNPVAAKGSLGLWEWSDA
jgi:hypothetical protein